MGYCCSTERTKKLSSLLFRLNVKKDSDEIDILTFCVKSQEFTRKKFRIFRYFKSNDITYLVQYKSRRESDEYVLYILANTGENYFFSLNYKDGTILDIPIPVEVGYTPTFQRLNNYYFISIGGADEKNTSVHLFDIYREVWFLVGNMQSSRLGAYALINSEKDHVYICGGANSDGDNSLEIETFNLFSSAGGYLNFHNMNNSSTILINQGVTENMSIKSKPANDPSPNDLFNTPYPQEFKNKKIQNDFLLRKVNPVVIPLYEEDSFLICGGKNLSIETDTCVLCTIESEFIALTNVCLPKPFEESLSNRSIYYYNKFYYFFTNSNQVVGYNILDANFEIFTNTDESDDK